MFEVPTDEKEPGIVVEVSQKGYLLHDRLVRPAMVGISKKIEENKKSVECIQILLNNGANKSNKVNGKTAADWAEERNLTDIVKMLKP